MAKHILIVDDDAGVRTVLGDMLQAAGYRVSLVSDGAGMRVFLAGDKSVDAVVIDSLMPGENSTDLALHAKALKLAAIMISGSIDKMDFASEHKLQLLRKPFKISELVEAVEKAISSGEYGQRDA